jgi:flagellar protein FlaF
MWSTFATDCGARGNGLPPELRAQIISIGLWVERFTSDVVAGRESIRELIAVNRTIMEGLRGQRLAA